MFISHNLHVTIQLTGRCLHAAVNASAGGTEAAGHMVVLWEQLYA